MNGRTTTPAFSPSKYQPHKMVNEFLLIKKHPEIKGIEIFEHCFLYTDNVSSRRFFWKIYNP